MSAMILFGGWCWFVIVALDDCAVLGFSPSLLKSMNNLERMQAVQRLVSRSESKETRLSARVAVTPAEGASSDAIEEGTQHDDQNTLTALSRKEEKTIKIIAVRHAISQANEFMHQPGNRWGDTTFRDDLSLVDSPLSERGMQQVEQILFPRMKRLLEEMIAADASQSRDWLVLISPLTRCLQTYMLGVRPALQQVMIPSSKITTMVVPLLRERVYTCSDTGRVRSVLEAEFTSRCPEIDWSLVPDSAWWYTDAAVATSTTIPAANSKSQECTQQNENDPKEWRPSGRDSIMRCLENRCVYSNND